MTTTITSKRSTFVFDDLTEFKFANEDNSLKVGYFSAQNGHHTAEYVTNSGSYTRWERCPNFIRYSKDKVLKQYIAVVKDNAAFNPILSHESYERDYDEILAENSKIFFEAILLAQREGQKICIPNNLFCNVLFGLEKDNYLTPQEAKKYQSKIETTPTLGEYQTETERSRDVKKAIALAYYYRNQCYDDSSVKWLSNAKRYLNNENLGELINLNEFFLEFTSIASGILFKLPDNEIIDAAARCPSIEKLDLMYADFDSMVKKIGYFLTLTISIETVTLFSAGGPGVCRPLNDTNITPIAEALQVNTSIRELNVNDTRITGEGVIQLLEAIKRNPQSRIEIINVSFQAQEKSNEISDLTSDINSKREKTSQLRVSFNRAF